MTSPPDPVAAAVPEPAAPSVALVDAAAPVDAAKRPTRLGPTARGVLTMLVSGVSNSTGAGIGTAAFPAIGPAGVVAVRQIVAAAILLPVARPPVRRLTWPQWWPVLLLAAVFALMNLSLYVAIDRIGLALAVTLEFLGPLSIALLGSRTRRDLGLAIVAALGIVLLVQPGPSSDLVGVAIGLVAAACWAAYILLNRLVGRRLSGLQAPALATSVSALAYLPVLVWLAADGRFTLAASLAAITAGVLSSVVPYAADLTALRLVPARFFSLFMSIHPAIAALVGVVLLRQIPAASQWLGIALVVTTNALAVGRPHRQGTRAAV